MMIKLLKQNILETLFSIMLCFCFFRFKYFAALHLIGFLFTFFLFILVALQRSLVMSYKIICWLLAIFILGSFSFLFSGNPSDLSILYYLMNYSLPILYVFISDSIVRNISLPRTIVVIKRLLKYLNIYLFLELFIRVFVISKDYVLTRDFFGLYKNMKHLSFSYSDCNYLGLFILWILCLTVFLFKLTNDETFKKERNLLIFFGFMSMSRSVMLTIIVIGYILFLYKEFKKGHFILIILNILAIPICILLLYEFLLNDASFRSKVEILQGLNRVHNYSLNNVLFGFGYGKGEYAYSYKEGAYGHLHIALFLGQIGIVGIIYFLFWIIRLNFVSKNNCFIIIFAFLLSGISLSFPDSSFFLCMSLIIEINRKYKNQISNNSKILKNSQNNLLL